MVIENDPSARIRLLSRGELVHPGQCAVCGNGTCDEGYIDLGVYFDYEGTLYLCRVCATQVGETAGLYTPAEVQHNVDLVQNLVSENDALKQELSDVKQYSDSLNRVLHSKFCPDPVLAHPSGKGTQPKRKPAGKAVAGSDGGEPALEESVTLTGSTDLSGPQLRDITFD